VRVAANASRDRRPLEFGFALMAPHDGYNKCNLEEIATRLGQEVRASWHSPLESSPPLPARIG
jgi:hypothetical protein